MLLGRIVIISLMVGLVVGGFVWYGWGLAENIGRLLTDEAERKTLGIRAREYTMRNCGWPSVAARYLELLGT